MLVMKRLDDFETAAVIESDTLCFIQQKPIDIN